MKMERMKTHIKGFDKMVSGGLPRKDSILLSGPPGSGKTVFSLQFLINGMEKENENALFLTFEEEVSQLKETAKIFGWDLSKYEDEGKLTIIKADPYRLDDIIELLEGNIKKSDIKRIVVDSVSALAIHINDPGEIRDMILRIDSVLRKNVCTALLISERSGEELTRFGVEEFIADGLIVMNKNRQENKIKREIAIYKMRGIEHSLDIKEYKISQKGIEVI